MPELHDRMPSIVPTQARGKISRAGQACRSAREPSSYTAGAFGLSKQMSFFDTLLSNDIRNPAAGDTETPAIPGYADAPAVAGAVLDLSSPERRFSRRR